MRHRPFLPVQKRLAVWLLVSAASFSGVPLAAAQAEPASECEYETFDAIPRFDEARQFESAGKFNESHDAYSHSLAATQATCGEKHRFIPTLMSSRAMIAIELGRFEEAERDLSYAESLVLSRDPLDAVLLARVLYTRGNLRMRLDQLGEAENDLKRTLDILKENPVVPPGYAIRTRSTLAGVYYMMGRPEDALEEFLPVVEAYRADPAFPELANALGNLGELYRALGDMESAARYFQESIDTYDAGGGPGHIGSALPTNNLAITYFFRADYEQAKRHFERALEIRREHYGDIHPEVADTLLNLGGVAAATGQFGRALSLFEQALETQRQIYAGDHESIADSLGSIGAVFTALASHEEAISYLEKAVDLRHRLHGEGFPGNAGDLSNLSVSYRSVGRYDEAESAAIESIELLGKGYGSDYMSMYGMFIELSRVYESTGRHAQALAVLKDGLELATKALGNRHPDVARLEANIGRMLSRAGDASGAAAAFENAHASLAGQKGRQEASAEVYALISDFLRSNDERLLAIYFGKRAVNELQELRAGVVNLDSALQRRYLTSVERVYRDLAGDLIDAGRLPEAQQVLAMLKEEEYSDFTRLRSSSHQAQHTRATYTIEEQRWSDRYGELNGELALVGEELAELQQRRRSLVKNGMSLSDVEKARLDLLESRQREVRRNFDRQLAELREYFADLGGERSIEFGRKDLSSLQALQSVLRRIEQSNGERVVLLTYLVTEERLSILLTSSNSLLSRNVDVSEDVLNRLVFDLRETLQDDTSDPLPTASQLYGLLIAPVQDDLDVIDAQVLLTSLDGALRYLPVSALYDGESYMAERYALGIFTPAGKLNLERRPSSKWTAAGLGVTDPGDEFLSLPSVGTELDLIVRETAGNSRATGSSEGVDSGVLDGKIWLNEAFTARSLSDALISGFQVVHVASHFVFKPGTERDSFLVLGDGDRLTLEEFVADDYPFENVDLLTLSACDTALGGDSATGKEVEGFGALAQNKGASAVLATLWPVADATTAELMAEFYASRQIHGMSKAQALRAVQRAFIEGDETLVGRVQRARGVRPETLENTRLSHPYYWAPFVLMGNWL